MTELQTIIISWIGGYITALTVSWFWKHKIGSLIEEDK